MMINRIARMLLPGILFLTLAGCGASAPAITETPAHSATPVVPSATLTPAPAPTLTATATQMLYQPPAARFLPSAAEVGEGYITGNNLLLSNLSILAELPVPRENVAAASFAYNGGSSIMDAPQEGRYYEQAYVVIVAPDEASARMFYALSQGNTYRSQAFLVVMPAAVYQQMGPIHTVTAGQTGCDEISIALVTEDIYGYLRSGQIPTESPLLKSIGGFSAERLAEIPPQLYLFAGCRLRNVLVLNWGSAPNNYDGKNAPIPDEVLARQVEEHMRLVLSKVN